MDRKHYRDYQAFMPAARLSPARPAGGSSKSRKLNIAVLMGGVGREREVSLQSGGCVAEALRQVGLNVRVSDITPSDVSILDEADIDVFFLALHGEFGEDGHLQQILEDRGLVYTGSGSEASRLAFDKLASKKLFGQAGVRVPAAVEFSPDGDLGRLEGQLRQLGERFVVKPVRQGSSVGVSVARDISAAIAAAQQTCEQFGDCMIEQFITGSELTIGILGDVALPVIEIRSKTGFYDYRAKYIDDRTEYLFDTIGDPAMTAQVSQSALSCFRVLGCRDFARVDFILSEDGVPYVLEVNTIPGFTAHSLLPKAAAKAGLSMSDLCLRIIEAALARTGHNSAQQPSRGTSGSKMNLQVELI